MNANPAHLARAALAVLAALALGCTPQAELGPEEVRVFSAKSNCASTGQPLVNDVVVYPAAVRESTPTINLAKGRYIYRCEERGAWLRVMFPGVGEKADCAQRKPGSSCATGWIRRDITSELLG